MKEKSIERILSWCKNEDYASIFIATVIIFLSLLSVFIQSFDFHALKFTSWTLWENLSNDNSKALSSQIFSWIFVKRTLLTFAVFAFLFSLVAKIQGLKFREFLKAFSLLFVLALFVRLISAEYTLNRYLEWAFWALLLGLFISNVIGVPKFLKSAIKSEFYIKTGLVIMGFSVLFSNIAKFGLYGIGIAWVVTPIVIIFMWYLGTRVFRIKNKSLVITLASATSVCGTSAAIATAAASKAKKEDLSIAVSISIIFTILMMVFEPMIIRALEMSDIMGGSLIGGTVDSTGAVVVAGTALGETAQKAAVLVKSIQNIVIGFIAFGVAVFFSKYVDNSNNSNVGISEIWHRFPKFILGFFVASLVASFIFQPFFGSDTVSATNKILSDYKNWAFVLAFLCIGLDTNFKEIIAKMQGGKVLWLYVIGQIFNILLTWLAVWLLLSGRFFPIPNLS